jgi:hypothetical protein
VSESKKAGFAREVLVVGGDDSKDQRRTPQASEHLSSPNQSTEPSDRLTLSQDQLANANAKSHRVSEASTKELLAAYQQTLDVAEDLPAVVWVPWGDKGLGRFLKVPYFRWFLRYFIAHHISKSLNVLNRRLHAIAALANDPDINKAHRETVKLYLQSLSPPPYRQLTFIIVIAAMLVVVPLRAFGNVLDVLPLVGAFLRVDITYVARAFTGAELGATVRATIVLLLGLSVVGAMMTSPFGLKRLLFNLYPLTRERIASTAAGKHASSVTGLYLLEEQVFREAGLQRLKEGKWDLLFSAFMLLLLLLLSVCLGLVAFDFATSWDLVLDVDIDTSAPTIDVSLPEVHWLIYTLPASISLITFVVLLRRLISAWKQRNESTNA